MTKPEAMRILTLEELREIARRQAGAIEVLTVIVDCAAIMRRKQKEYFLSRDVRVLKEAKNKEIELDVLLTAYRDPDGQQWKQAQ